MRTRYHTVVLRLQISRLRRGPRGGVSRRGLAGREDEWPVVQRGQDVARRLLGREVEHDLVAARLRGGELERVGQGDSAARGVADSQLRARSQVLLRPLRVLEVLDHTQG